MAWLTGCFSVRVPSPSLESLSSLMVHALSYRVFSAVNNETPYNKRENGKIFSYIVFHGNRFKTEEELL